MIELNLKLIDLFWCTYSRAISSTTNYSHS